ncbi:prephenate dehydrogenase [Acetatifactor aquisgranensis]|uniref:prephenate dehydrogenase n=1 Tax=Acetatifactor aquisgranensis TaxID=2941233 RepID=UPI00203ADF87|nr:prephenate dehydrogenase [Acetatifactor aquisgranensis]
MSCLTCGFIGLGLIGGSIARALKKSVPDIKIIAYDISRETLSLAKDAAVADVTAEAIDSHFSECDYIFLCAPVQRNDSNLAAVKHVMKPECLLTDVGSVKTAIHEAVAEAGLEGSFIGGHPMAGSERVGFANSRASLLENAYYILTPTASVPAGKTEKYRQLVAKTGAIPLILDYQKHDYVTAAISHLPHVIAASLVNLVREHDSEDGIMKMVAAGGFKDITRIASSSALMWQQICLSNTANISALLADYIEDLKAFQKTLDAKNEPALYDQFEHARAYRDSFISASSGPIKRAYNISVDIDDKSGALARIAALLAEQGLSIKNIGITHNRESDDGVLKVEFYDESSMNRAREILTGKGYHADIRI